MNVTPELYRAIAIKQALKLYADHKIRVNRMYTPTAMLKAASSITGKPYKRGQYRKASEDIAILLDAVAEGA